MSSPRSAVWAHFAKLSRDKARCKVCGAVLSCAGSSTSGMIRHLRMKHVASASADSADSASIFPSVTPKRSCALGEELQATSKKRKLFFNRTGRSLAEVVARLVAVDGVPPESLIRSDFLRDALYKDCLQAPSSFATTMRLVTDLASAHRAHLRDELSHRLASGQRFALSVRRFLEHSGRPFLRICLSGPDAFSASLGAVAMQETDTSGWSAIRAHLETFGVALDRHCVACVSDGSLDDFGGVELMSSYSRALHLAVCSLLFEVRSAEDSEEVFDDDDEEEGEEGEAEDSDFLMSQKATTLKPTIRRLVELVRSDVQSFVCSPERAERLQKAVFELHGRVLYLQLDRRGCRWRSLQAMLCRYVALRPCMQRVLFDLGATPQLPEELLPDVRQLAEALEPVQVTYASLTRPGSSLIAAEGALRFLCARLTQLGSPVSLELLAGVRARVLAGRHTALVTLLQGLHNPDHVTDDFLPRAARSDLMRLAASLLNRLRSVPAAQKPCAPPAEASIEQQLQHFIAESEALPRPMVTDKALQVEWDLFQLQRRRSDNLELLYRSLLCVRPAVEAKPGRCRRLQLSDACLSDLAFLHACLKL